MGNYFSSRRVELNANITRPSSEDDSNIKYLSDEYGFTYRQIEQFEKRFNELIGHRVGADSRNKTLNPSDLTMIPEFKKNPLHQRIADVFFSYASDPQKQSMTFEEFVKILSTFRSSSGDDRKKREEKKERKLDFIFKIYDTDNCGFITHNDLCTTLRGSLPKGSISDEKIVQMATKMISEMDFDCDNKISFYDYCQSMIDVDIDSKVNLPFFNRKF